MSSFNNDESGHGSLLISCPSCEKMYSKRAFACPECGTDTLVLECEICVNPIYDLSSPCPQCGDPCPIGAKCFLAYNFYIYGKKQSSLTEDEVIDLIETGKINGGTTVERKDDLSIKKINKLPRLNIILNILKDTNSNYKSWEVLFVECHSCNNRLSGRADACPKCGSATKSKCHVCQELILLKSSFCPECADPDPFNEQQESQQNSNKSSSERILCSDGTCMGTINEKGVCSQCGKSPTSQVSADERAKVVPRVTSQVEPKRPSTSQKPMAQSIPVSAASFFKTPLVYVFMLAGFTLGGNVGEVMGYGEVSIWMPIAAIIGGGLGFSVSLGIDGICAGKGSRITLKWVAGLAGWLLFAMILKSMGRL